MMCENGVYHLLKKYFSDKDYYNELVDLFHEVTFITTIGQLQDMKTAGADVTTFTMEKYKTIVANKTGKDDTQVVKRVFMSFIDFSVLFVLSSGGSR